MARNIKKRPSTDLRFSSPEGPQTCSKALTHNLASTVDFELFRFELEPSSTFSNETSVIPMHTKIMLDVQNDSIAVILFEGVIKQFLSMDHSTVIIKGPFGNGSSFDFLQEPALEPEIAPYRLYNRGKMYLQGLGLTQSDVDAAQCFEHAGRSGHGLAQEYMGDLHIAGRGVERNYFEASRWYFLNESCQLVLSVSRADLKAALYNVQYTKISRRYFMAASQGNHTAQYKLSTILLEGKVDSVQNVEKDVKGAAEWLLKSATGGCPEAMFNLGEMYEEGNEWLRRDLKCALKWYSKASDHSHPLAQRKIFKFTMQPHRAVGSVVGRMRSSTIG